MSDDLNDFFAKKAQKTKDKKKKKGVINLEDVGHHLERKAKKQEEKDREEEEIEKRQQDEEDKFIKRTTVEDSEWLEFNDPNKEIKLSEFGIKEMRLMETVEDEEEEERINAISSEPVRRWNIENKESINQVQKETVPKQPPSAPVYVPRMRRQQPFERDTTFEINNEKMFPSLAAADEIEKNQKDMEKQLQRIQMAERAAAAKLDRERALEAVKQQAITDIPGLEQMNRRTPIPKSTNTTTREAAPAPKLAQSGGLTYVPPHLRNAKQSQPVNSPSYASSAQTRSNFGGKLANGPPLPTNARWT